MTRQEAKTLYAQAKSEEDLRALCKGDLFFLLVHGMGRSDVDCDWLYERCREVQAEPDGCLDLWARAHYKSTIITVGETIRTILNEPNTTIGIFSHTKSVARAFLKQIKREFEGNVLLQELFPHICPPGRGEKRSWSEDDGLVVVRDKNPKESTLEAWGLVDGMPTGKHFDILIYDDVVTPESVTTPDQIKKTTQAWQISLNLGATHGARRRMIGTRYHAADTYADLIRKGSVKVRLHAATVDGSPQGAPVFLSPEVLEEKKRDMGPYVFACHGAGSMVLMADWSQKPIEEVRTGDMVLGWTLPKTRGGRCHFVPSRVVATQYRQAEAVESVLADGSRHVHTPSHKWWTARFDGKHKTYAPLSLENGPGSVKALIKLQGIPDADMRRLLNEWQCAALGYLAAMLDGEGALKHSVVNITQDAVPHPNVCDKIAWALESLGVPFSVCDSTRDQRQGLQRIYTILGGSREKARLAFLMRGLLGKQDDLLRQSYAMKVPGKKQRVACVEQRTLGVQTVHNIQTETGNYVVDGCLSKNCQMLQNPHADAAMGFKTEWFWKTDIHPDGQGMNRYLVVDPAGAKKKSSDYTVMWVVGLNHDGNYYVLDGLHDRLNLLERTEALFDLHKKWQPTGVGYERYGMQADIEHIRAEMERRQYRFPIIELGGSMPKEDRIRRLVPVFAQGRVWFPQRLMKVNYEGRAQDLVIEFFNDEFLTFPVSAHDDMLDCLARILDDDLGARFPKYAAQVRGANITTTRPARTVWR